MKFKSPATKKDYIERINKVIHHINKNLDGNLSLDHLAKIAFFSPSHFHRVFKSIVGETLKDYITRIKMEKAVSLLISKIEMSITDIAMDCGFSSSATFARSFKDFYGISASEFRNESLNKEDSETFALTFKDHFGTDIKGLKEKVKKKSPLKFKHPFLKNFSPSEYNAHHQVWTIIQDKRGVLFFGNTEKGIIEFDGVNFQNIPISKSGTVRSLDIDSKGTVYVSGIGELGYLDTVSETKYISLKDKIKDLDKKKDIKNTLSTSDGIYFQAPDAIYYWDYQDMSIILGESSFTISAKIRDQVYLVQKGIGLMGLKKNILTLVSGVKEIAKEEITVMLPYREDGILFFSEKKGGFVFDGKNTRPFKTQIDGFLLKNVVKSSVVLPGGLYGLGTQSGGVVIIDDDGKIKYIINKNNGLRDNSIHALYVDRQSGLWLGMNDGIARIEESNFFTRI